VQVILCALGGFIVASVYFYVKTLVKGYLVALISYFRDLIGQVGVSIVLGITLTKITEKMLSHLER